MSCARWRRRICRGRTTASPMRPILRRVLLGRLNQIYGIAGKVDPQPDLSRQLRLHPRLSRRRGDDRCTDLYHDRRPARFARRRCARSRSLPARCCLPAATRTTRTTAVDPDRLSPAPSDRDQGNRAHCRDVRRHQPRRPQCRAARRRARFCAGMEEGSDRRHHHRPADRHAERARRRARPCARSARSSPPRACRPTRWMCGPISRKIRASSPPSA